MPIAAMPMDKTEQRLATLQHRVELERLSRRSRGEAPHKLRGVLLREVEQRRREGFVLPPPIDPLEDAGA
jgi:hypothetical protein